MDRKQWRALIALNTTLIAILAIVATVPLAEAQRGRQRGEYTMVGARVQGISESAIWIIDTANQAMVVLRYDQSTKDLKPIGFRNLAADANQARGGRGGR